MAQENAPFLLFWGQQICHLAVMRMRITVPFRVLGNSMLGWLPGPPYEI